MELDDLKQSWERSTGTIKPVNTNIMELIQHKSNSPLAVLKRNYKKPLILLPMVVALLILNLTPKHNIFSDALFWLYIGTCVVLYAHFFYGYRMVSRMQTMDGTVKSTLQQQVSVLEQGLRWRMIGLRVMVVVFIVLLEVLLYFQQEPSLVKWYAQPPSLRLGVYAGAVLVFYLFTGMVGKFKYKKHIQYLKQLVAQMQ